MALGSDTGSGLDSGTEWWCFRSNMIDGSHCQYLSAALIIG